MVYFFNSSRTFSCFQPCMFLPLLTFALNHRWDKVNIFPLRYVLYTLIHFLRTFLRKEAPSPSLEAKDRGLFLFATVRAEEHYNHIFKGIYKLTFSVMFSTQHQYLYLLCMAI